MKHFSFVSLLILMFTSLGVGLDDCTQERRAHLDISIAVKYKIRKIGQLLNVNRRFRRKDRHLMALLKTLSLGNLYNESLTFDGTYKSRETEYVIIESIING